MALALTVNLPVSQPSPKAEPLSKEPLSMGSLAKELLAKLSPRPAPPSGAPQAQASKLLQADTFMSAPAKPSGAPQLQAPPLTNVAADDQAALGWKSGASFVYQNSPTGCGTANLAQINDAACGGSGLSPEHHQLQVEQNSAAINSSAALRDRVQINLKDGATPDEMASLLGMQGQKVVRGFDTFAADYMNGALQQGQFGLTLLDSSALRNGILPSEQTKEPGALHWVTIDGIDDGATREDYSDDRYRVKDPINGVYWVSEKVLKDAVAKARAQTGSGGVLIVENEPDAKTREAREALALQNLNHTAAVGKGNGIGSKPTSVIEPS